MTHRQKELLDFIRRYQAVHGGVSPSIFEMQAAMGVASKSVVIRMLDVMEDEGLLTRERRRARRIVLHVGGVDLAAITDRDIITEFARRFWSHDRKAAALAQAEEINRIHSGDVI